MLLVNMCISGMLMILTLPMFLLNLYHRGPYLGVAGAKVEFTSILSFLLIKMFIFNLQIAAQNCRKRKVSQMSCLESELRQARSRKEQILSERVKLLWRQQELARGLDRLERNILVKMEKDEREWIINVDQNLNISVLRKLVV